MSQASSRRRQDARVEIRRREAELGRKLTMDEYIDIIEERFQTLRRRFIVIVTLLAAAVLIGLPATVITVQRSINEQDDIRARQLCIQAAGNARAHINAARALIQFEFATRERRGETISSEDRRDAEVYLQGIRAVVGIDENGHIPCEVNANPGQTGN